jgi:heme-degrading monooxygenase HmoA/pimeloyl-ACP methyl ester carboxylesterase
MSTALETTRLDEGEELFLIPGPREGMSLFLRRLGPSSGFSKRAVLYVHGATFPSALSIAHRFDGQSWRDVLCDAGFSVWGLDFYGFGGSDRYPEMSQAADSNAPLGLAAESAEQLIVAAKFILEREGRSTLSMISHSWGSMPVGRFAGSHPTLLDRWVLFAPIARREPPRYLPLPSGPAWRMISAEDQWKRFVEDVPVNEPPVLQRQHFDEWAQKYLATDPASGNSNPPAVKTPAGPFVEILRAWHGQLAYDPAAVQAPIAIVRGAWDGLVTDSDAQWLFEAFSRASIKHDTKIGRGTHLMHLETMRFALWRESISFLLEQDEREKWTVKPNHNHRITPQSPSQGTNAMFSVIFEVNRKPDHVDEYLDLAKHLKPILEKIDGFVDNERFESQLRKGWLLSHSSWRDEKSVIRWRTDAEHHRVQEKGRSAIFQDYHLRVGEVVSDSASPKNVPIPEQRFDETEAGEAKYATFTEITMQSSDTFAADAAMNPGHLGLEARANGLMGHDVFKSITNSGKFAVLCSWRNADAAKAWVPKPFGGVKEIRHRVVRIVRDYGMFDRREAPQYYPEAKGVETKHPEPAR